MSPNTDRAGDLYRAAVDLFIERGYRDVDVADITTRCGVSQGTFYNYFRNKRDVLQAIMDRTETALHTVFHCPRDPASIDSQAEFVTEFEATIGRAVSYAVDNGALMSFAALTAPGVDDESYAMLQRVYRDLGAEVEALLAAGRDAGWVRDDIDVAIAGQAVVSCVAATILPVLLGSPSELDATRAVRACNDYLLGGLRRGASGTS